MFYRDVRLRFLKLIAKFILQNKNVLRICERVAQPRPKSPAKQTLEQTLILPLPFSFPTPWHLAATQQRQPTRLISTANI